eukprot:TRINITY_DN60897_c0_g1_i1.p1 TRINITY_DN60897_c0_g1~~TRINITY_DN60897_c0_g1_i1.p1  ORF type:complete len:338 (+),score=104.55 TRINITY_DN60897_c0_g1_i1:76-1014(+)
MGDDDRVGATVFVRQPDGTQTAVTVGPSETVGGLKKKLHRLLGIPVIVQVLTFQGDALSNDSTLADCGVGSEAVVALEHRQDRDELLYLAGVAETAERYEEMWDWLKLVAQMPQPLSEHERNLCSVAAKNIASGLRVAIRQIDGEEGSAPAQYIGALARFRKDMADKLLAHIEQVVRFAEVGLERCSQEAADLVWWSKVLADQHRMMAEALPEGGQRQQAVESADQYYQKAYATAQDLPPTNPIRLGCALNYSVQLYEIKKDAEAASKLAKEAFDEAITALDTLSDGDYKDATLIMQLLRDNLTLWTQGDDD